MAETLPQWMSALERGPSTQAGREKTREDGEQAGDGEIPNQALR